MVDFSSLDDVKRWLDAIEPEARRREVAEAIATRAVLRALPLIWPPANRPRVDDSSFLLELLLLCFRFVALPWAVVRYMVRRKEIRAPAAAAASAASSDGFAVRAQTIFNFVGAGSSAAFAAAALHAPSSASSTEFAVSAVSAATADDLASYVAISADATWLDNGLTASNLSGTALWSRGMPKRFQHAWRDLKTAMFARDEDWDVWTDWYDARLAGDAARPPIEALEIARATIADEIWKRGPKVVNAEIKRLIAEHTPPAIPPEPDEIPPQQRSGTRFGADESGRIDVLHDALSPDALQRLHYDEMRFKAEAMAGLGQMLGDLAAPVQRLLEALPPNIADVWVDKLWSRANTLRGRIAAHANAVSDNFGPNPARLEALVASHLEDFIGSYNVFALGEPRALELDSNRLGPRDRDEAHEVVKLAAPIAEAAANSPGVATLEAGEILKEEVRAGKDAPNGIHGDQATALARNTAANFVGELLRRAYAPVRAGVAWFKDETKFANKEFRGGFYKAAGTLAFSAAVKVYWPAFASFVVQHADALKAFVTAAFHNPKLLEIIDLILEAANTIGY